MKGGSWLGLCACSTLLAACSQVVAGRGGGDETPNTLTLTASDGNGAVVAGALVRIRPVDYVPGEGGTVEQGVVDLRTDSLGRASVVDLPFGRYRIEVIGQAGRRMVAVDVGDSSLAIPPVELARSAKMNGTLARAGTGDMAYIPGTEHGSWIGDDGQFSLDSLPAGGALVRTVLSSAWTHLNFQPGAVVRDTLWPDSLGATSALLADFAKHSNRVPLGSLLGNGWIYLTVPDTVGLLPYGVGTNTMLGLDTAGGNRSFHYATTHSWSEMGFNLSRKGDLRGAKGLSFRAKGTGSFEVRLLSNAATGFVLVSNVVLDTMWQEFFLPLDSMRTSAAATAPATKDSIDARASSFAGFSVATRAAAQIWIDDIRILGKTPGQIWGLGLP